MVDWKKEVKLSDLVGGKKKRQDTAAPEAVEAVVQADKTEQTSIWKKELSFGRKKQPKAEPVEDTPEVEEQTLELDAPASGLLVVNESWFPGWTARVDGRPAPILRVNSLVRGVPLAAGRHRVSLNFAPTYFWRPFLFAFALMALFVAGLAWAHWRTTRSD